MAERIAADTRSARVFDRCLPQVWLEDLGCVES
jgi:hypothetical protein